MKRRKFFKSCSYATLGLSLTIMTLSSCKGIYYATAIQNKNRLVIAKSEFWIFKKDKKVNRNFVLIKLRSSQIPICLYKIEEDKFIASLLECTHKRCELNVGGGIYTCPCHGSEYSMEGKVLQGPAVEDLKTFKTDTDNENIYILLS